MIKIYHNTRCGKSRCAIQLLEEKGATFEVIEYLKTVPTKAELTAIIGKLGIKPLDLIRKKEPIFLDNYKGKTLTDEQWIDAMLEHPILIERPIVVNGDKAVVARPAELLLGVI